jgi:amino acid transporter
MKCFFHPDIEATGTCSNCKRSVCQDCQTTLDEKKYCNTCVTDLYVEKNQKSMPLIQDRLNKNWFEKHLNWTWVIGLISTYVITFFVGLTGAFLGMRYNELKTLILIVFVLLIVGVSIYVLIRKKRNLGWILLVGWLSPLWLSNKRIGQKDLGPPGTRIE